MTHSQLWRACSALAILALGLSVESDAASRRRYWDQVGSVALRSGETLSIRSSAGLSMRLYVVALSAIRQQPRGGPAVMIEMGDHCPVAEQCAYDLCRCPSALASYVQVVAEEKPGWFPRPPIYETESWRLVDGFLEFELPTSALPCDECALWSGYQREAFVNGVQLPPSRDDPNGQRYAYIRILASP